MATVNAKTIGPGGDYATLTAWFAACPPDLTAADASGYIYRGQVLNTELVSAAGLDITGIAGADATHYIELTAASGCSFADHANKATNPLRYNAAVGAALNCTAGNPTVGIACTVPYTRITRLQIQNSEVGSHAATTLQMEGNNSLLDGCIVEGGATTTPLTVCSGSGSKFSNSVFIYKHSSWNDARGLVALRSGAEAHNLTLIASTIAQPYGFSYEYTPILVQNCYVGNCTDPFIGAITTTDHCFTDKATPPTGWTTAPYSTATFASITAASMDVRLAAGSALINAGADDTGAQTDIIGTARPAGAFDVGAWEVPASATNGTATGTLAASSLTAPTGSATGGNGTTTGNATGALAATTLTAPAGAASGTTVTAGTITISAIKDLTTGGLRANETGITVIVNDVSTGALVAKITGETTDASGDCAFSHASIVIGTEYRCTTILSDGSEGTWKYTAA